MVRHDELGGVTVEQRVAKYDYSNIPRTTIRDSPAIVILLGITKLGNLENKVKSKGIWKFNAGLKPGITLKRSFFRFTSKSSELIGDILMNTTDFQVQTCI